MENSKYPKFTFTWWGAVTLVVGLFVGTMAVSLFSLFGKLLSEKTLSLKNGFLCWLIQQAFYQLLLF